jgi:hypothetical protein
METKPKKETVSKNNFNHLQIIHHETIKREQKYESKNMKYEYTFSPYTCNINKIILTKI